MCVRDPIIRRKGQKAPARKSHVMKAEKEWNTDCYSNQSSSSSRKRQIMSLLKEKETTTRIEKDAADNKRRHLEMKKNAADSSSSAMLMVTRDFMCAEVVVEEQQTHINQIQKNCCNNNEKEEERTEEDQSAVLLRDLMCGEVLQWPTEIYNGSTESLRFFCSMLPFDDYTKTRANSSSSILLSGQQQHRDEEEGERLLDPVKNQVRENFEEAMGVLLEREGLIYYKLSTVYLQSLKAGCKIAAATEDSSSCGSTESSLSSTRRRSVNWIFKLMRFLKMSTMTAAHAVAFLDRFLSQRVFLAEMESEMQLAATACLWIAAKMQDNCPVLLSSLQDVAAIASVEEQTIWDMEAVVLHDLEWRMVAVTVSDFVVNMVAHLEVSCSLPLHLVPKAIHQADLIIHAILPEVEFLDYEPSVVGICVMQCLLDEIVPIQAASHMAFMRRALAVDMVLFAYNLFIQQTF
ncbi:hypothetical protein CY35_07G102000 [Sphagnum magellanicum]|uniref:Uncharacterized protein n=1 Tax=Sphagnum magellanicum TaxID=128215 RepID=A0ACB8HNK8_9BRYO|nr:hypothetical protein CY35_07G102000 [Sphagnum magellanicum]